MTPREHLFALEHFGIKLGLANIAALLEGLNRPERAWTAVHVAGTNGKGSVTAMVERGLRAAGYRTGRYTSPHLATIEERIAIDGRPIDAATFDDAAASTLVLVDRLRRDGLLDTLPTFFEVTTAMAFEIFRRQRVAVAVVEVGLGGRFDATNVLSPAVTAITSIALDHERHLGSTLPEIAFEKAGIAKPSVPLVVGDVPDDARRVIVRVAGERGAPVVAAGSDSVTACAVHRGRAQVTIETPTARYGPLRLGLNGLHQIANAVVAARILETCRGRGLILTNEQVETALTDVDWPARLEWLSVAGGRFVLLDAAHNPAGAAALAEYLQATEVHPLPIVMAIMKDKDVAGMVAPLAKVASVFVATQADSARSLRADELAGEIGRTAPGVPVEVVACVDDAIAAGFSRSRHLAIAGSIFLVGPTRARLLERGARPLRETPALS
jgi:dihydrofolate synthase / folylpolyglutamate synthase